MTPQTPASMRPTPARVLYTCASAVFGLFCPFGRKPSDVVPPRPETVEGILLFRPEMLEVGILEVGTLEVGTLEVGTLEVGTLEVGTLEVGTLEVGTLEVGTLEVGTLEVGTLEVGTLEGFVGVVGFTGLYG